MDSFTFLIYLYVFFSFDPILLNFDHESIINILKYVYFSINTPPPVKKLIL
jgi:hypothetical protein